MTNGESYPPYSGYGTVIVPVECVPYPSISGDAANGTSDAHNATPPKIKEARLFLTTIGGGNDKSVTFKGCPTLETTVRFETDKAGPVSFDLHRFPGGMTSHTVNASFDKSAGKYYARYQKQEQFTSTTYRQSMAESTAPLGGNTGWEEITVHCGGGLTVDSGDDHDGLPPQPEFKGDFSFAADEGTKCPRKGKALIAFTTPVKNNVHYSLHCTNGHFSGVAQPVPRPGGGYVAPALVAFDIADTTQANCVLKSVAPGAPKIHTVKGHKYRCVKTTGVDASGDLTGGTRPNPKEPDKPGTVATDPPRDTPDAGKDKADKGKTDAAKIVCSGGIVRGGACVCGRGDKKVKVEKNAFRCVKAVVSDPPKPKDGTKISGGKIKGDTKDKTASGAGSAKSKGSAARGPASSSRLLLAPR